MFPNEFSAIPFPIASPCAPMTNTRRGHRKATAIDPAIFPPHQIYESPENRQALSYTLTYQPFAKKKSNVGSQLVRDLAETGALMKGEWIRLRVWSRRCAGNYPPIRNRRMGKPRDANLPNLAALPELASMREDKDQQGPLSRGGW